MGLSLRRFHLKTFCIVRAYVFLSLSVRWESGAESLFATISSLESGRKAIIERTQCTKEEPPLLSSPSWDGGRSSSLSSLFAEMKIIAAVARSLGRSPFSSFFITHPLIFGWLSSAAGLAVSRGRESKRGLAVRRPNLIPCSDHHRPRRRPL